MPPGVDAVYAATTARYGPPDSWGRRPKLASPGRPTKLAGTSTESLLCRSSHEIRRPDVPKQAFQIFLRDLPGRRRKLSFRDYPTKLGGPSLETLLSESRHEICRGDAPKQALTGTATKFRRDFLKACFSVDVDQFSDVFDQSFRRRSSNPRIRAVWGLTRGVIRGLEISDGFGGKLDFEGKIEKERRIFRKLRLGTIVRKFATAKRKASNWGDSSKISEGKSQSFDLGLFLQN